METPTQDISGGFDVESIEALQSDEAFRKRAAEMRREIQEQKQERTPKTGSPTVHAQRAEQAEELMQAVHPLLDGLNDMLGERYPGLEYTPGQVDFVATLGGKIMSKYVDISAEKYGEEIALGMFLLTTGTRKGIQAYQIERDRRAAPRRKKNQDGDDQEARE